MMYRPSMDAFSSLVELLHPQTLLIGLLHGFGSWSVQIPPQNGPSFYLVLEGGAWFHAEGRDPVSLQQGDYVLSTCPVSDTFSSELDQESVLADVNFKQSNTVAAIMQLGDRKDGRPTQIMGGVVLCEPTNLNLLTKLLPDVVHIHGGSETAGRLHGLLGLAREEAETGRPGRSAMLSRLVEMILIETLRREAEHELGPPGLLSGLQDPGLANALAAIHSDPANGWTLESLSHLAGMSRSLFARRFHEKVGRPPLGYLIQWRMALAKDALVNGTSAMEEIAERIGYRSASALSSAFSKQVGSSPKDFSRTFARSNRHDV